MQGCPALTSHLCYQSNQLHQYTCSKERLSSCLKAELHVATEPRGQIYQPIAASNCSAEEPVQHTRRREKDVSHHLWTHTITACLYSPQMFTNPNTWDTPARIQIWKELRKNITFCVMFCKTSTVLP